MLSKKSKKVGILYKFFINFPMYIYPHFSDTSYLQGVNFSDSTSRSAVKFSSDYLQFRTIALDFKILNRNIPS